MGGPPPIDKLDSQALLEITGDDLGAESAEVSSIIETQLRGLGFAPTSVLAEPANRGEVGGIEYSFERDASYLKSYSGFIAVGGVLALETLEDGRDVFVIGYGTVIETADGKEAGPRVDWFSSLPGWGDEADEPVILSHNVIEYGDGRVVAADETDQPFATGYKSAAQVYRSIRRVTVIRGPSSMSTYRGGAETAHYFEMFVPGAPNVGLGADEAITELEIIAVPRCGDSDCQPEASAHIVAASSVDIGTLPVSFILASGSVSVPDNAPATAYSMGEPVEATYLTMEYADGAYQLRGVDGIWLPEGDYKLYVAIGPDVDDPESIFMVNVVDGVIENGTAKRTK